MWSYRPGGVIQAHVCVFICVGYLSSYNIQFFVVQNMYQLNLYFFIKHTVLPSAKTSYGQ